MNFATLVKYVRKELNLSQEQLARELSISFSTINRWENEKSKPSQMAKELFYGFCKSRNVDVNFVKEGGRDD